MRAEQGTLTIVAVKERWKEWAEIKFWFPKRLKSSKSYRNFLSDIGHFFPISFETLKTPLFGEIEWRLVMMDTFSHQTIGWPPWNSLKQNILKVEKTGKVEQCIKMSSVTRSLSHKKFPDIPPPNTCATDNCRGHLDHRTHPQRKYAITWKTTACDHPPHPGTSICSSVRRCHVLITTMMAQVLDGANIILSLAVHKIVDCIPYAMHANSWRCRMMN